MGRRRLIDYSDQEREENARNTRAGNECCPFFRSSKRTAPHPRRPISEVTPRQQRRRPSQPRRGNTNAMRSRFEQQGHRVRRLISTDPTPEIVPALEAKPASGFLASAMDSQAVQVLFLPMLFIVYWVGKVISSPVSKDDKSGYVSVATARPEPERAIEIVKGD